MISAGRLNAGNWAARVGSGVVGMYVTNATRVLVTRVEHYQLLMVGDGGGGMLLSLPSSSQGSTNWIGVCFGMECPFF